LVCSVARSFRTFSGGRRLIANLPALATSHVDLEPRPLPSTGITRPPRYYGPLRHPIRPGLSLAGVRLVVTRHHRVGLPVLRPIPLCTHAGAHTPAEPLDAVARLVQRRRPSRSDNPVGLRISSFEACSAFTHVPAYVLARSPKVTFSEGFDRFVTSTTASAATDWSD